MKREGPKGANYLKRTAISIFVFDFFSNVATAVSLIHFIHLHRAPMHVCVFYLLQITLIFTVTPAFNLVIGYELSKLGGHFERRVILGSTYYFLSIFSSPLKLKCDCDCHDRLQKHHLYSDGSQAHLQVIPSRSLIMLRGSIHVTLNVASS